MNWTTINVIFHLLARVDTTQAVAPASRRRLDKTGINCALKVISSMESDHSPQVRAAIS